MKEQPGLILILSSFPTTTTNKLYSNGGALFFGNVKLTTTGQHQLMVFRMRFMMEQVYLWVLARE